MNHPFPIRTLLLIAFFLFTINLRAEVEDAEILLRYASALSTGSEAVAIGPEGLTIKGNLLQGSQIIRPALIRARAAEIFAEASSKNGDIGHLRKAVNLWNALHDDRTPIGYLRLLSSQHRQRHPEYATFCDIFLARYYLRQGDHSAAEKALAPYINRPSRTKITTLARATLANLLLHDQQHEKAREIAKEITETANREDYIEGESGYALALAILAALPEERQTDNTSTATTQEAQLLEKAKGNPRLYLQLGNAMSSARHHAKAIQYWGEYRKHFANDDQARRLPLQISKAFETLNDPVKALATLTAASAQYPDFPEGIAAATQAIELYAQAGQSKETFTFLDDLLKRARHSQSRAAILGLQGQLYLRQRMIDEAADRYITLLVRYGDQDAAKDALANLHKIGAEIKNWRKFTQQIQSWLAGQYGKAGQLGTTAAIPLRDASSLRRLALGLYAENSSASAGISWLKALGMKSHAKEHSWYIKDEAWFNAQVVKRTHRHLRQSDSSSRNAALRLGLRGWEIATGTDEGFECLQAAYNLLQAGDFSRTQINQFIKELESMRGRGYDDQIIEMLIPLYEKTGNQKMAAELRQRLTK